MDETRDVIPAEAEPIPVDSAVDSSAVVAASSPDAEAAPEAAVPGGEHLDDDDDDGSEPTVEVAQVSAARSRDEAASEADEHPNGDASAPGPGIQQDPHHSTVGANVAVVEGNVYVNGRPVKPLIRQIAEPALARYGGLFVRPAGFDEAVHGATAERGGVLLVHGRDGAGKLCYSVNVALQLADPSGQPLSVCLYERRNDEVEALFAVLEKWRPRAPACVIVEDVFEKNVTLRDLASPGLQQSMSRLVAAGLWLILTTDLPEGLLAGVPVPRLDVAPEAMQPIFSQHVDWYELTERLPHAVAEFARRNWPKLQEVLLHPAQIESFCESLAHVVPHSEEELVGLAKLVTTAGREEIRAWFNALATGEQLFALLVLLFDGWERRRIEEAFLASIRRLRADGMAWLGDPARRGLGDLLAAVKAHDSAGRIEFDHPFYRDAVDEQLANRRHLLWPLIETLVEGDLIPCVGREHAGEQRALGQAVGRLAVYDPARFERLLDELSADTRRRPIAVHAMEAAIACDYEATLEPLLATIRGWLRSEDDRLHVAAHALGRIHQAIGRLASRQQVRHGWSRRLGEIERVLREVALRGAKRAVASAVARMNNVDPQGCAAMLRSWMGAREKPVRQAGRAGVTAVFEALAKHRRPAGPDRFGSVLGLIQPLLESAGADSPQVTAVFAVLCGWLSTDAWRQQVAAALLAAATYTSAQGRQRLRAALAAGWRADAEDSAAARIAQAVAARSHSMDGLLRDWPSGGKGVLVIDPGFLALDGKEPAAGGAEAPPGGGRRHAACGRLANLMQGQLDLAITYIGVPTPPVAAPGCEEANLPPAPLHTVPRLLMPALAAWREERLRLVTVIGRGPLWDLEDAAARRPRIDHLVVVSSGEPPPPIPAMLCVSLDDEVSDSAMIALDEGLRLRWAGDLATAEADAWAPTLTSLGVDVRTLAMEPELILSQWTQTLDEPCTGTARLDVARRILCGFAWFAAWSLDRCIALVHRWLKTPETAAAPAKPGFAAPVEETDPGGPARRCGAMAVAIAKMLFAVHSVRGVPAGDQTPALLFDVLAEPLAERDRDGADAVLAAVRRWLEDPVWAEYLAGDVREGRGRLLRWVERFKEDRLEALRALLPLLAEPLDRSLSDEAAAMMARIDRVLAGPPPELASLRDNQQYLVIVFDAAEPIGELRRRWADLAAELFAAAAKNPDLAPAIYRMGEVRPAWTARNLPVTGEHLVRATPASVPRLLAPLLTASGLQPERVRRLVVLGTRPVLDVEDFLDGAWQNLLVFDGGSIEAQTQPWFAELPPPVGESAAAVIHHLHLT